MRGNKKERRQKRRVKTQLKTNTSWKKENNSKMPTTEKRARFAAVQRERPVPFGFELSFPKVLFSCFTGA